MDQAASNPIVFRENQAMLGQGQHMHIPITFQGGVIYFGTLKNVEVPLDLHAELAATLQNSIDEGSFPETVSGDIYEGCIKVSDGHTDPKFKVVLSFQKNDRDDYFLVESIQEQK